MAGVIQFQREKHMEIPITDDEVNMFLGNFVKIFHVLMAGSDCQQIFYAHLWTDDIIIFISDIPKKPIKMIFPFGQNVLWGIGKTILLDDLYDRKDSNYKYENGSGQE